MCGFMQGCAARMRFKAPVQYVHRRVTSKNGIHQLLVYQILKIRFLHIVEESLK